MLLVVDFHDTPGVGAATNLTTVRGIYNSVRANNGEGDLAGNLFCLSDCLFILVRISRGLENVNVVVGNVGQNLKEQGEQ